MINLPADMDNYMCPFCVTPWKCNGPHIDIDDLEEFEHYVKWQINDATKRVRELHSPLQDRWIDGFRWCAMCEVEYPCLTIEALDGEQ